VDNAVRHHEHQPTHRVKHIERPSSKHDMKTTRLTNEAGNIANPGSRSATCSLKKNREDAMKTHPLAD
jgi:hypothetical protein